MRKRAFLDSSVLVDALYPSHPDHHPRAVALLDELTDGTLELHLSATVLFETAFVLEKRYNVSRQDIAGSFRALLGIPTVITSDRFEALRAIGLWEKESPLSFADCYHLVLVESLGLDGIYAFDRKMGRYPPVERLEP